MHGFRLGTQYQVLVEKPKLDKSGKQVKDLFGNAKSEKVWEDDLKLGLDLSGPIGGVLFLLAGGLFYFDRRKNQVSSEG